MDGADDHLASPGQSAQQRHNRARVEAVQPRRRLVAEQNRWVRYDLEFQNFLETGINQ